MMVLACPARPDQDGAVRCGLPAEVRCRFSGGREGLQRGHDGRDGGGSALGGFPAAPERKGRRPNTVPAYYLGHPAAVWITALRPAPPAHHAGNAQISPSGAITTASSKIPPDAQLGGYFSAAARSPDYTAR